MCKQGLNHAKSRIRDAWKKWVLKQGLNYVKSRIREAAAQAQAEFRPRPNTNSWTAAFVLRASFAVGKAGAVLKQGLNHAKSRIREHGRGGGLSRG